MAELSEEDCIAILHHPLEQAVRHLRPTLAVINESEASDSQKTLTSDESDSTEADCESGKYHMLKSYIPN